MLAAFQDRRGAPFDVLLNLVSDGDALKANSKLLREGGRLVTTIHFADEACFEAREHRDERNLRVLGPGLNELAEMVVQGKLVVDVAGERNLEEAGHVLDDLKAHKNSGKILLRIAS